MNQLILYQCQHTKKLTDPATGAVIAEVATGTMQDYEACIKAARNAYKTWSNLPAPQRGEIVRQIGDELRKNLQPLGKLVSLGKIEAMEKLKFIFYPKNEV